MDDSDPKRSKIWYLPAHWVEPVHTREKLFDHYRVASPNMSKRVDIPGEDMLYFHLPDPADPLGALSPMQTQARAVSTDEQIQTSQWHSMKNGALPDVIIKAGRLPDGKGGLGERPTLTAEQRSQLIMAIKLAYGGPHNHGQPAIVDGLIDDIVPYSNKPDEMDWLNSSSLTKGRVMQGIGTNPIIAGEIEGANRASAAVADDNFCNNNLNPLLVLASQIMTRGMAPRYAARTNEKLVVWIEPCRPRDEELQQRKWDSAASLGFCTGNEYRRNVLNQPPLDGLDEPNVVTLQKQQKLEQEQQEQQLQVQQQIAARRPRKPMNGEDQSEFDQVDEAAADRQQQQPRRLPAPSRPRKRDFAPSVWPSVKMWIKTVEAGQTAFTSDLDRFFSRQAADVILGLAVMQPHELESYANVLGHGLVDRLYNPVEWDAPLKEVARRHMTWAAEQGAFNEMQAVTGSANNGKASDFHLAPKTATAINGYVHESLSQSYWHDIQIETKERIAQALTDGFMENGNSLNGIVNKVREALGQDASRERSRNIARTELTGALNHGHQVAMQDLADEGLITGKRWLTLYTPTTRNSHYLLGGTVVPVSDSFNVGGYKAPYPGHFALPANERCNCHCAVVSVRADDPDYEDAKSFKGNNCHLPAGGPGGGRFCSGRGSRGGRRGGGATSARGGAPARASRPARSPIVKLRPAGRRVATKKPNSAKVAHGIAHHKPSDRETQVHAQMVENRVAKAVRGKWLPGNKPMDVIAKGSGKMKGANHGIEVKTVLKSKNQKITVHSESRGRKERWHNKDGSRVVHTVVVDERHKFRGGENKAFYSGHAMYYKRGTGAFRLTGMVKIKSPAHLRKLMNTPTADLPKAAQPPKATTKNRHAWR